MSGWSDFEVTGAVETAGGVLEVSVRVARPDAACVRCGSVQLAGQGVSDPAGCATG